MNLNVEIVRCVALYGGDLAILKRRLMEVKSYKELSPIQQECVFAEVQQELLKSSQVNC